MFRRFLAGIATANLADGFGAFAFPWVAAVATRSPSLVALVVVAQRLSWLLVSLPAGVLVDRMDRRRLLGVCDAFRAVAVGVVAIVVAVAQTDGQVPPSQTSVPLICGLIAGTLLLGLAEVVRDNTGQAVTPWLVPASGLEAANGQVWTTERVANTVAGPALAAIAVTIAVYSPFAVAALLFGCAAALSLSLPPEVGRAHLTPSGTSDPKSRPTLKEAGDGLRWIRGEPTVRAMAISLAGLNFAGALGAATFVLYAIEVMQIGPVLLALLGVGGAVGSVVGGWATQRDLGRMGRPRALRLSVFGLTVMAVGIAAWPEWPIVLLLTALEFFCITIWSVITVSYRQQVITPARFGRVNSAYRFIGWGALPIGALVGGPAVTLLESLLDRDRALRGVWLLSASIYALVAIEGVRRMPGLSDEVRGAVS